MNSENLKNFKKGNDARRNLDGRPPKYISKLKAQGYKLAEINDCIVVLLSMTIAELREVENNPLATILEATIAKALLTSYANGNLAAIETIVSRRYGKPKENVEVTIAPELIAARNLFFALIHKDGLPEDTAMETVITAAKNNGFELNEADIRDTTK